MSKLAGFWERHKTKFALIFGTFIILVLLYVVYKYWKSKKEEESNVS